MAWESVPKRYRLPLVLSIAMHVMVVVGYVWLQNRVKPENLTGSKSGDTTIEVALLMAEPPPPPPPKVETPKPKPTPKPPEPTPATKDIIIPKEEKLTPTPTRTPTPTPTPKPTEKAVETPKPTATPKPTDTPKPTATPKPTDTPKPTATPKPTPKATPAPSPEPTKVPAKTPAPVKTPPPSITREASVKSPSKPAAALSPNAKSPADAKPSASGALSPNAKANSETKDGGNVLRGAGLPDYYARQTLQKVARNFNVPPEDRAALQAAISFRITRSGEITNIRVRNSSGNAALDELARKALTETRTLLPLPDSFKEPHADVEITFTFDL